MPAVLEVSGMKKRFGGITAVDGVSFAVQEREILGIIGPNGCGKSTLFNCILGQLSPNAGEVRLDGRVTTGMRPSDLNRLGVSRTFQLLQIFPRLSVRENLILAAQEHKGSMLSRLFGPRDAGLRAAADEMIGFFRLGPLADELAGGLSYGQQKLLDAAMAFMAGPRLVLLDEPAGGVNPTMLGNLNDRLKALTRAGRRDLRGDRAQHGFRDVAVHRVLVLAEGRFSPRVRPPRCATIRRSSRPILDTEPIRRSWMENVVAGYGAMTILNGSSFCGAARRHHHRHRPQRRRQIDRVQDDLRPAAAARRACQAGRARRRRLVAARADRRRRLLHPARTQHLSAALGAPQYRAWRRRRRPRSQRMRARVEAALDRFPALRRRPRRRPRRCRAASRSCSRSCAACCSIPS